MGTDEHDDGARGHVGHRLRPLAFRPSSVVVIIGNEVLRFSGGAEILKCSNLALWTVPEQSLKKK